MIRSKHSYSRTRDVIIFVTLFLILLVTINSLKKVYIKYNSASLALSRMQQENIKLKEREINLNNSLKRLVTEEGKKFEIRKKLNVAEAGEQVAIIVDKGATSTESEVGNSLWQRFKNLFSDLFN